MLSVQDVNLKLLTSLLGDKASIHSTAMSYGRNKEVDAQAEYVAMNKDIYITVGLCS